MAKPTICQECDYCEQLPDGRWICNVHPPVFNPRDGKIERQEVIPDLPVCSLAK